MNGTNFLIGLTFRFLGLYDKFAFNHEKYEYTTELSTRITQNPNHSEYLNICEYLLHTTFTKNTLHILTAIIDYSIASYYYNTNYYLIASCLGHIYSSLENAIFFCLTKGYTFPMEFLFMIDPYFICLSNDTLTYKIIFMINYLELIDQRSKVVYRPCVNVLWFFYQNIFQQYYIYFYRLFFLIMLFLSSIINIDLRVKITILLFFKPATYKNYLFLYCMVDKSKRVDMMLVYVGLCFFNLYVNWLYLYLGIGNLNFVNWTNLLFVIISLVDYNIEVFS